MTFCFYSAIATSQPCIIIPSCSMFFPCGCYCCLSASRRTCCPEKFKECDIFTSCFFNRTNGLPEYERFPLEIEPRISHYGPEFNNDRHDIISIHYPNEGNIVKRNIAIGVKEQTSDHPLIVELLKKSIQN